MGVKGVSITTSVVQAQRRDGLILLLNHFLRQFFVFGQYSFPSREERTVYKTTKRGL